MKQRKMKRHHVVPLPLLEKMTTKRLLGYLQRLRMCHETEYTGFPRPSKPLNARDELTKDTDEWKQSYEAVRQILSSRENVI